VAKRRRRKRRAAGDEVLVALVFALIAIGLIGSALVWLVSVLLKPFAVVVATVVTLVGAALLYDGGAFAYARVRGREPQGLWLTRPLVAATLRAIRPLMRVLGWPLRLFREPRIRARTIGELLVLNPSQFEEAIAQSLRDNGYQHVSRRGGPGDLGVDITCHDPNGQSVAFQCKRYAPGHLVGSREIQLFIGMVTTEHRVDRGVFITTSGFTAPAVALAKRHPWIRLIDGPELARIIGPDGAALSVAQAEPEAYGSVLTGNGSTIA